MGSYVLLRTNVKRKGAKNRIQGSVVTNTNVKWLLLWLNWLPGCLAGFANWILKGIAADEENILVTGAVGCA